jgi:hypothetical protein
MTLDTTRGRKEIRYPRVKANYPVLVLTVDGPVQGETKQISTEQVFVSCPDPLRLHDIASMSIEVAKDESLVAEAEVIWSNRYGPDDDITPRGMIVRFRGLSNRDRKRLRGVIAKHYRKKVSQEMSGLTEPTNKTDPRST